MDMKIVIWWYKLNYTQAIKYHENTKSFTDRDKILLHQYYMTPEENTTKSLTLKKLQKEFNYNHKFMRAGNI